MAQKDLKDPKELQTRIRELKLKLKPGFLHDSRPTAATVASASHTGPCTGHKDCGSTAAKELLLLVVRVPRKTFRF